MNLWKRLYKKYYPICTDAEAEAFVNRERRKILSILHTIVLEHTEELLQDVNAEQPDSFASEIKHLLAPLLLFEPIEDLQPAPVDVSYCERLRDAITRYATGKTMRVAFRYHVTSMLSFYMYPLLFAWRKHWGLVAFSGMALGLLTILAGVFMLLFFRDMLASVDIAVAVFDVGMGIELLSSLLYVIMHTRKRMYPERYP